MVNLTVDPEIRDIIPNLRPEEHEGLMKSLVREGCRDKLVTWQGVIIDGHNRYDICILLGIPFETLEMKFNSRHEAIAWVLDNQLNRRNLTDEQRTYLLGKRLQQERKPVGAPVGHEGKNQHTKANGVKVTPLAPMRTKEKIAEEQRVSPKTIQNASTYASAVDHIANIVPDVKERILSGNLLATKKDIVKLAELTPNKIGEIVDKAFEGKKVNLSIREEERRERYAKLITPEPMAFPKDKKYQVIYADPPWKRHYSGTLNREIENHYPTMDLQDICNMTIPSDTDCVLFMWCPSSSLADALTVISSWGFIFKTCAVWVKESKGTGYYYRQQHELILLATKGNIGTPAPADRPVSVIMAPREEHSKKPQIVREQIEKMYPILNRLEVFARDRHKGWDVYGNDRKLQEVSQGADAYSSDSGNHEIPSAA
ncbi:MAG: hypothetical protein HQK96_12930 [Nitrospirae bacterium]|nr:hypothetical protein [Nitrospirota bacterium]